MNAVMDWFAEAWPWIGFGTMAGLVIRALFNVGDGGDE